MAAVSEPQFADPAVSRRKFNREIKEFRSQANEYGRRGWFLVLAEFPHALVVLATVKTQPIAILCGVWFDYSNYDAVPPSVRLVNPLTREPYKWSEVPTKLPRMPVLPEAEGAAQGPAPGVEQPIPLGVVQALPAGIAEALAQGVPQAQVVMPQPLMQAYGDDDVPFLCIAGVREYHNHPAHSGDRWESHRTSGAGRLLRLIQVISKYGLETIDGFEVQFAPVVRFHAGVPPQ